MPHHRTRIKICGIRDSQTARAAVDAGADMLGFVFVQGSPRYVSPEEAGRIAGTLPAGVQGVGLFADHSVAEVMEAVDASGLTLVQLHGREGPEFARQLRGVRVVKAVAFEAGHLQGWLQPWREAQTPLAGLLFDTPPDGPLTGGGGQSFDWEALARLDQEGAFHHLPPFYLAGGLTPGNVERAVRTVRPFGVDVSSGVESSRGVKDPAKIAAFCAAVRRADHAPA